GVSLREADDPQDFDREHDLRCSRASEMVEVMASTRAEEEVRSVTAAVVSHVWGVPFPWPQPSHVRQWAEAHLDGPRSAVQVLHEVAFGEPHPLAGLFDGWRLSQIRAIGAQPDVFAWIWLQAATSVRLSPSRREVARLD